MQSSISEDMFSALCIKYTLHCTLFVLTEVSSIASIKPLISDQIKIVRLTVSCSYFIFYQLQHRLHALPVSSARWFVFNFNTLPVPLCQGSRANVYVSCVRPRSTSLFIRLGVYLMLILSWILMMKGENKINLNLLNCLSCSRPLKRFSFFFLFLRLDSNFRPRSRLS